MKKQNPAEGSQPLAQQPTPTEQPAPPQKWTKSVPIYGTRSVAEIVTEVETGVRILVLTDLTKGSKPRKFPLAAVDIQAMRKPLPEEPKEIMELLQIAANTGRVILKSRETQAQERNAEGPEQEAEA